MSQRQDAENYPQCSDTNDAIERTARERAQFWGYDPTASCTVTVEIVGQSVESHKIKVLGTREVRYDGHTRLFTVGQLHKAA